VLVKIAMCGTCGSDLKIYDGHFLLTLPYGALTPGHEWTGTVVALGDNVDEVAMGDRVLAWVSHVGIAPLSLDSIESERLAMVRLLWQRLSAGRLTRSRGVHLASKNVGQVAKR
jgi:NADPH:quinone reductase-like Zn-dependent oxidoreductase